MPDALSFDPARASHRSLIVGGWLGAGQKPHPEDRRDAGPKGVFRK